jgi:hypothetical protein
MKPNLKEMHPTHHFNINIFELYIKGKLEISISSQSRISKLIKSIQFNSKPDSKRP